MSNAYNKSANIGRDVKTGTKNLMKGMIPSKKKDVRTLLYIKFDINNISASAKTSGGGGTGIKSSKATQ